MPKSVVYHKVSSDVNSVLMWQYVFATMFCALIIIAILAYLGIVLFIKSGNAF